MSSINFKLNGGNEMNTIEEDKLFRKEWKLKHPNESDAQFHVRYTMRVLKEMEMIL